MSKRPSRRGRDVRARASVYLLAGTLVLGSSALWGGTAGAAPSSPASRSGSGNCAVTIGLFGPFTGSAASYGQYVKQSFDLALRSFPKKKLHCKVTSKEFDTKGTTSLTPPLATSAAQDSSVVAVVGPTFSGPTQAAGPIFNAAGLPMISGVASEISLAQHGWKVFHRTVESDAVDGAGDALYLAKYMKVHSVALVNNGEAYGKGVELVVQKALSKDGVKEPVNISITPTASDYSAQALQIKGANVGAVYCGCLAPEAARLLKALRKTGVTAPFVGPAGIETSGFLTTAGSTADGAIASAATPDPAVDARIRRLDAKFKKVFHHAAVAGFFVPQWYDAATAVLKGIASGHTSRASLNKYLDKVNFNGVSGRIRFTKQGNVVGTAESIYKVHNGNWVFLKQIKVH